MKYFSQFKFIVFALAAALAAQAARADDTKPSALQFNFELNHPLVYSLDSTTRVVKQQTMEIDSGNRSIVTTNLVETRLKMKLTPVKKSGDGTWTIWYQPSGFENDVRSDTGSSHVTTSMRGLDVKGTQNGIVVVDTARSIGNAEAKALKQAVYTKMLSGYFDFKPDGEVAGVNGDPPFVDYWNETLEFQMGFFDVTFSNDAVAAGGTWGINRTMKYLQGIKLGNAGVLETNVFTRKGTSTAGHAETITASMAVKAGDLTGNMEAGGQNTSVDISQFIHEKNGSFEFDTVAGCITRGTDDEHTQSAMNTLVQGHTVSIQIDIRNTTKFELQKE